MVYGHCIFIVCICMNTHFNLQCAELTAIQDMLSYSEQDKQFLVLNTQTWSD